MRDRKIMLFCGGRKVGKSTRTRELIQSRNERTIVFDSSGQVVHMDLTEIDLSRLAAMRSGTYRINAAHKDFFKVIWDKWGAEPERGGFVICEDASVFLKPNKDEDIYKILVGLRHKNIDLLLITHSIAETPQYIIRQVNDFIFFKTADNWKNVADRFPESLQDEAQKIFNQVNASKNRFEWKRLIIQ